MGTLLMQRGMLVLHASAVNIDGGAVAFIGCCGDGKSTIATTMNKIGYSFVTDDILTVKFDEINKPSVFPSFPKAKLDENTIIYMKDKPDSFQKIHPETKKYSYNIIDNFSLNSLPLKNIYILENSNKNDIISLKAEDALIELIKNSYANNLFSDTEREKNLFQCANLVKKVPVKRLKILKSLNKLENLIKIVEKDVNSKNKYKP
ncbi:hypothetical protein [Methanobacterium petrolearium]